MTPNERGRFCGQCQKTVVDFTTMTDDEVLATLQATSGNTCGRFFAQQLDRPLQLGRLQRSWLRVKWFWAALLSGALFAYRANAQTATYDDTVVVTVPKSRANVMTVGKVMVSAPPPIVIQGQVTDEKGMPMVGVTVQVTGTSQGATTNGLGMYELRLKDPGPSVQLQYSYVGYMPIQHQLKLAPLKSYHIYQQNAQFTDVSMVLAGEVVIVRRKKTKPAKTVKQHVAQPTTRAALQVYPNPAIAGNPIHITQLFSGKYSLQLLNSNGQQMASACLLHTAGSRHLSWTLPTTIAAGLYTLVLVDENLKPQTLQILVQ